MTYTKKEEKNYNVHIIKTDKFKTITVKVNFKRELKKEEITIRNLLINSLMEGTKKYPSKRLLEIKTEELYDLAYRAVNYATGKYTVISFDMTFINPKYTEDNYDEESFKFLAELIHSPNEKNGVIDKDNFSLSCNIMRDYLKTLPENPVLYSQMRMLEEMDDSIISYRNGGYIEDLEKINSKMLYEYYKDVINNDIVDIFVIGDIENDRVLELISKYIKLDNNKKSNDSHFYTHSVIEDKIKYVNEKVDKEQSTLVLGLKMDELTDFEKRYVLSIYNYILGGSTESNLFKTVREDNSLCYYITSSFQALLNIGIIRSGINSIDYEAAISLINKELNNMKEGKFDKDKIENAKVTYINGLSELEDNPDNIISLYAGIEYLKSDNIDVRKEKIKKVTYDDIVKLANKIHLTTIYLLEGSDTNEED